MTDTNDAPQTPTPEVPCPHTICDYQYHALVSPSHVYVCRQCGATWDAEKVAATLDPGGDVTILTGSTPKES